MVTDAESHAAEDQRAARGASRRRTSSTPDLQTEKTLRDNGDKLPADARSSARGGARRGASKDLESDDAARIDAARQRVEQAMHKVAELLYKAQGRRAGRRAAARRRPRRGGRGRRRDRRRVHGGEGRLAPSRSPPRAVRVRNKSARPPSRKVACGAHERHRERRPTRCPILPLKNTVIFPHLLSPLLVNTERSKKLIDAVMARPGAPDARRWRCAGAVEGSPRQQDLHRVGTVLRVAKMLRFPDESYRLLVQGVARARIDEFASDEEFFRGRVERARRHRRRRLGGGDRARARRARPVRGAGLREPAALRRAPGAGHEPRGALAAGRPRRLEPRARPRGQAGACSRSSTWSRACAARATSCAAPTRR